MRKLPLLLSTLVFAGCPVEDSTKVTPPPTKQVKQPVKPTGAASQPAAAPGSQPAGAPHGKIEAKSGGGPVSGLVKLHKSLSAKDIKKTDILFIMARKSLGNGAFGSLIAVERHPAPTFPMRYELSSENVMVPGVPFVGPMILMARLDRDGDPMTRDGKDLYAVIKSPLENGATGAHLILNRGKGDTTPPKLAPKKAAAPKGPASRAAPPAPSKGPASAPASRPK